MKCVDLSDHENQRRPSADSQRVDRRRVARPREPLPRVQLSQTPFGQRSYITAGYGSPTVVFESGVGEGKEAWADVFNAVSAKTCAFAYDRAGYGGSARSELPRDGLQIVTELRALLLAAKIMPPYVLVGHSLGGAMVNLYARTHPADVVGVILVDARQSSFVKQCKKLGVPRWMYRPPAALYMMARAAIRGELDSEVITSRQVKRAGPFPAVPLVVLAQSDAFVNLPSKLGKAWTASQLATRTISKISRFRAVEETGHHVHKDRPEVVVKAILDVVAAARDRVDRRIAKRFLT